MLLPIAVQALLAVQAYRFCPGVASVLKNCSPAEQAVGKAPPVLEGLVAVAAEKSTFRAWVRKSICICAYACILANSNMTGKTAHFHPLARSIRSLLFLGRK